MPSRSFFIENFILYNSLPECFALPPTIFAAFATKNKPLHRRLSTPRPHFLKFWETYCMDFDKISMGPFRGVHTLSNKTRIIEIGCKMTEL